MKRGKSSGKHLEDLLLLGDPRLYQKCEPVNRKELTEVNAIVRDLHRVLFEYRAKYNAGRAIAAPQLGYMKRVVYMNIDRPLVFINPELLNKSEEMIELWDDCMSFPNLLVRLRRHRYCTIQYLDENWQLQEMELADDLSELLQHECDHLDGILATQRAIDERSLKLVRS